MTLGSSVVLGLLLWTISWSFGLVGGIREFGSAIRFELPYLLLTYSALLYLMRPTVWRMLIAAAPIVILYLTIDVHYVLMHSVFKLDELLLLPEGLNVSPAWLRLGAWFGAFAWMVTLVRNLKRRPRDLIAPILLLSLAATPLLVAHILPRQFLRAADLAGLNIIPWSDRFTSAVMGRTTALLLFAATKRQALDELARQPVDNGPIRSPALLAGSLQQRPNLHIVVLESFLDPQRFSKVTFRTPVAAPGFAAMASHQHLSRSPVFGGGTAQVEFELLCGVPALELYSPAEFNMFTGEATPCLPNLLAEAGYRTVATQAYKPEFFNSEEAYRSMGFREVHFPSVYANGRPTYLRYELANSYIFDGDLLGQNLLHVESLLADGRPFVNYVLGIYGHLPNKIDTERFPDKVEVEGVNPGSQAYRAIQQFYYRSGAVAEYVQKLRQLDPKGLILVTSDHLPPLDAGPHTYRSLGYLLPDGGEYRQNVWFFYGPEQEGVSWPEHDYEFMDFLLDTLTEGRICRQLSCKNRESWSPDRLTAEYNRIIALGAGLAGRPTGR